LAEKMNSPFSSFGINLLNNHPLRRWVESIGQSHLYVSGGGENKSKFRVWFSYFLSYSSSYFTYLFMIYSSIPSVVTKYSLDQK
jgi:hypothetical protein